MATSQHGYGEADCLRPYHLETKSTSRSLLSQAPLLPLRCLNSDEVPPALMHTRSSSTALRQPSAIKKLELLTTSSSNCH
ncbi:hypothetical protein CLAFUW4_08086 [Fulvia fulva]|uniref:Uncharacterized protein n=1 Tax=Passalora fulva TaxID=5499 RepID=A0A9Q8LDE0_PASFU|nr:uncharacterized protein CLAFUR5_08203 [Fulvia fulva]KAK4629447.1 hypothetical protein CLAFUR4_08091 [Fulvia fulva]KAK4629857.1 hypothetical protein CLAFUR0_08086 [Fulvia fulva]UJO15382.1 hypothetical protein CLAFUR5_08203 [Fulvia fulva]WPV12268.1 hypothetical protein CLAFUW4_08086 [Fulvia fulva]WPV27747.1 hypothetical protein CLAFUW7_08086 [Fulvia fulva]